MKVTPLNSTTVFKLSVYGFLAYCSIMLCVAQQAFLPQGLLLLLIPLAYYLTEVRRSFALPVWVANTLGLIAFGISVLEFQGEFNLFQAGSQSVLIDSQIRAGTNLIVYLSWIVIFMEKRTSYYWGILTFGVLLVALGCMFTNSTGYSLLLLLFLIGGLWTLVTFMIYEAQMQHHRLSFAGASTAPAARPSLPAASEKSRFHQPSQIGSSIKLEKGSHWYTRSLLLGFLVMCVVTFCVSILFYLFIPRSWVGNLRRHMPTPQSQRMQSGFNDTVRLGRMGSLLSSSELVMEFGLTDHTGENLDLEEYVNQLGYEQPYFRGNVLTIYEGETWKESEPAARLADFQAVTLRRPVRQSIRMMGSPTGHLFSIYPASDFDLGLEIDRIPVFNKESTLWKMNDGYNAEFSLEVELFRAETLKGVLNTDFDRPFTWQVTGNSSEVEKMIREARQLPPGLEAVGEIAETIARQSLQQEAASTVALDLGSKSNDVKLKVVDDLTAYLLSGENFTYDTELAVVDPDVDPVVDFLLNTKKGHCEYFATSLVMMCRSLGIPARLVTGFRGATKNDLTDMYSVKQNNAHAWVEVYMVEGEVPKWYVFDPTPEAFLEELDRRSRTGGFFSDAKEAIFSFWRSYVVNMSDEQQFNTFTKPLLQATADFWRMLRERGIWMMFKEFFFTITDPEYLFSRYGVLLLLVLSILALMGRRISRSFANRFSGLWGRNKSTQDARRKTVYFNERFKQICRKQGLEKHHHQTDREFAIHVQEYWRDYLTPHGLQYFPMQLTNWFYQIRFGEHPPQAGELGGLNDMLDQFEQQVKKIPRTQPGSM